MTQFQNRVWDPGGIRLLSVWRYPAWAVQESNLRPPACKAVSPVLRPTLLAVVWSGLAALSERLYVRVSVRLCSYLRTARAENVWEAVAWCCQ